MDTEKSSTRWFVTSPHRVARGTEEGWIPYGVRHARQVGSSWTECRLPALGWPMFWEMPFLEERTLLCAGCRAAVIHAEYGPGSATASQGS
jgi:hypothetical protein